MPSRPSLACSLAILALLGAGCEPPDACTRLNDNQGADAQRTCAFVATVEEDETVAFSAADGAPVDFVAPAVDRTPNQATLADGTRLSAQPWGLTWSVPAGDPSAERVVDRVRRKTVRRDSVGAVVSVAARPDGRLYAVGLADGAVWVRSEQGEQRLRVREGEVTFAGLQQTNHAVRLALAPDGGLLVAADALGEVSAWDTDTGRLRWRAEAAPRSWVAVSHDGARVAAGATDKAARVWDAASGQALGVWSHPEFVVGVSFTPGGRHLVARLAERYEPLRATSQTGQWLRDPVRYDPVRVSGGFTHPSEVVLWGLP